MTLFLPSVSTALLALSMLTAPLSAHGQRCEPTEMAGLDDPFYIANAPYRNRLAPDDELANPANVLFLEGQVLGKDCVPYAHANLEVWYAGAKKENGMPYSRDISMNYRGQVKTDECGRYNFTQTFPVLFLNSPNVHFRVTDGKLIDGEDNVLLQTQMFFEGMLASNFNPDESQVVLLDDEEDGSKSAIFNINLLVAGNADVAACGTGTPSNSGGPYPPATTLGSPVLEESTENETGVVLSNTVSGNDECELAAGPLTVTGQGSAPQNQLTVLTTGHTMGAAVNRMPSCGGLNIASPGSWFHVQGSGGLMTASTCWPGTNFDTKLTVFGGGNCTALQCIAANDDASPGTSVVSRSGGACHLNSLASRVQWRSVRDETYHILVHSFNSNSQGVFQLNVESLNDQCQFAAPLSVGDQIKGNTKDAAFPFGGKVDNCGNKGVVGGTNALWYRVLGTGGRLSASTCHEGTLIDTKIHVFFETCSDIDACMEGDTSIGSCAEVEFDTVLNKEYFLLVQGNIPFKGQFELSLAALME